MKTKDSKPEAFLYGDKDVRYRKKTEKENSDRDKALEKKKKSVKSKKTKKAADR